MEGVTWNLWHGCKKKSEGCKNCYVYRADAKYDRDPTSVHRTAYFNLPIARNRKGEYKIPHGTTIWTCFTSDFLFEDADEWREEAWDMMRERSDCKFVFLTKRIERLAEVLPKDWGDGWDNVTVGVTCENQERVDERLPIFKALPIKHKVLIHEPLLSAINIEEWLGDDIEEVVAGGESGSEARVCDYDWILSIREQCKRKNVTFRFKQTGAKLIKSGKLYTIKRQYQHSQAKKAGIDYDGKHISRL